MTSLANNSIDAADTDRRPGVCLVLGGGGFKGMAHVGVFKVLEEEGIRVERIVGTSAGALMGSAYAHLGSADEVQALVDRFVEAQDMERKGFLGFHAAEGSGGIASFMGRLVSGLKRQVALERMFRRSSAFGGTALRYIVRSFVPNVAIEELTIPMAIAALDVLRGEEVLLTEGPTPSAVCASSAVPGFFPPVEREGRLLVDAGIVNNLPTQAARGLGAVRIVAVDLSAQLDACESEQVGMDVLLRAQDISTHLANRRWSDAADVVIYPKLSGRSWLDPGRPDEVIEAGIQATQAVLPEIRALVGVGV
ncbi:MAG: hypothetical protein DHS20C15_25350 [Planctomycetota bacterium]|nr:MAG: hypothetical protein DHS20C15_25350 [Planctomycetota bacterium]